VCGRCHWHASIAANTVGHVCEGTGWVSSGSLALVDEFHLVLGSERVVFVPSVVGHANISEGRGKRDAPEDVLPIRS